MPRVSATGRAALPDDLRRVYDRFAADGGFDNQLDVLAASPPAFRHLYGLIEALREEGGLDRRTIEIAVVTTSTVNACPYCIGHHGSALVRHGLPAEAVQRILEDAPPGLSARDLAVRDYARAVTERAWGIRDAVFERLHAHFDDRQIVELTVRIGLCTLFNKLNQALEIEMEADAAAAATAAGIAPAAAE